MHALTSRATLRRDTIRYSLFNTTNVQRCRPRVQAFASRRFEVKFYGFGFGYGLGGPGLGLESCIDNFCRAMLCISAVIAVMRCLSVRLSVTFVDHVKTNRRVFEFFSPSGSHTILVFPYQTGWRYSDGNPPNGGVECRCGIGINRDSGLIAGYRRLLDVRSAKNIYRRRS